MEWKNESPKARKRLAELVTAGLAVCRRCGRPVHPGQAWDVGHLVGIDVAPHLMDDPANQGVEHRHCNRSAGARYGNRKRRTRLPTPKPLPAPSREW